MMRMLTKNKFLNVLKELCLLKKLRMYFADRSTRRIRITLTIRPILKKPTVGIEEIKSIQ